MIDEHLTEDARIVAVLNERAGTNVRSVFDLVNSKAHYPKAIYILLAFLPSINDKWIKEGVVRALTVKEARGKADQVLVKEFEAISPEDSQRQNLKWAIGNALAVVATDAVAADLLRLAQDKIHGKTREMLVVALGNLHTEKSIDILINLLRDKEVCGHAIIALRKLKARKAEPFIKPFTAHSKAWIRREAQKALSTFARY